MAILTLDQLRAELRYDNVFEVCESVSLTGQVLHYRSLIIRPERDDLPTVIFCMDDKLEVMEAFSIHSWCDELFQSVSDAVKLARQFVNQNICVVEALGANDKYWGSELVGPKEIPLSLENEVTHFRRWFFGKEPITEPVDFSRYVFDDGFRMFFEKNFVSEFGIETCSTELGTAITKQISGFCR